MKSLNLRNPYLFVGLLAPLQGKAYLPPQQYDYGFQLYQEEDDRIRVEAHYLRGSLDLTDSTQFRFQYLHDAISGASPTGILPGGVQPFYADLEDVREGILGALAQRVGDHRIELELSRSEEDDYLSYGFALSDELELNQKNTTVSFGVNYLRDTVTVPLYGDRRKESFDLFTGITQIVDRNTTVSANLTLGFSNGYLNDPYKLVQREEIVTIVPGFTIPVVNIYRENRPDERFRQVLRLEGQHYFEEAKGTLGADLRLSHDDFGIFSQTVEVQWRQELGERLLLVPFFRYYHQNAADFFVRSLNEVAIGDPAADPKGNGPNYSADYRLSSLSARSFGLRLHWQITDAFSAMAAYERYVMDGVGDDTAPGQAYPSADLFTLGARLQF